MRSGGVVGDERHLAFKYTALLQLRARMLPCFHAALLSGPTQSMQQLDIMCVVAFVCETLLVLMTKRVVDEADVTSRQP